jgi:hypothetical protein
MRAHMHETPQRTPKQKHTQLHTQSPSQQHTQQTLQHAHSRATFSGPHCPRAVPLTPALLKRAASDCDASQGWYCASARRRGSATPSALGGEPCRALGSSASRPCDRSHACGLPQGTPRRGSGACTAEPHSSSCTGRAHTVALDIANHVKTRLLEPGPKSES